MSNETTRDFLILLLVGSFLVTVGIFYKEGMYMPETMVEYNKEI
tara:strand:+ start:2907 stop:3038 length:132 start_codon:yes stop_codon:yes gene_type:complete